MALTQQFPGREADAIAAEIFESLGITLVPIAGVLTDFSKYAPQKNSVAIISTAVEASDGRRAQTLNRGTSTYPAFTADAKAINQKEIKIYPDYYAVDEVDIPEAEGSLLRDPKYIQEAIIPASFQGVVRQVAKDLYTYLEPHQFLDVGGSTATGSGANTGIAAKLRAIQLSKGQMTVEQLGNLESLLFNELMPDGPYTCVLQTDFHNSLASNENGGGGMNWLNYTGTTAALTDKKYLKVKNFDIHRVHFLKETITNLGQQNETSSLSVEKAGNLLSDLAPGNDASNRNFRKPFTPNTIAGQTTSLEVKGTGSWTYGQVPNNMGVDADLGSTPRVVGIGFHKRAMGVAAWGQYNAQEIIGRNPSNVQTSFVTDPTTGFPFRIMVYHQPELHKYTIECSAWYGFAIADPRAAAFILSL